MSDRSVSRRTMTSLVGATAIGVPLLAACGGGDSTAKDSTGSGGASDPTTGTTSGPTSGATSGGASGGGLTTTSDIPVGSGKIFADQKVVVTQPTAGEFKGFSSTCTHQACQVTKVENGSIDCPCHGSQYSIVDGSVQGGPAPKPLPEVALTVQGDQISLA